MTTPGHTPESISILVFEHPGDETAYGVLTGDALFIGDVGRPDLLASVGVTADELGRMLYDSVQHKLMGLPDEVRVFPAHGAGSACGKNLSTERQSTIGNQRAFNYACQPMSEEQFLAVVTEGQPAAPGYFIYNATLNKQERDLRDTDATVPAADRQPGRGRRSASGAVAPRRPRRAGVRRRPPARVGQRARRRPHGRDRRAWSFTPDQHASSSSRPRAREQEVATRFARIGFDNVRGLPAGPGGLLPVAPGRRRAGQPAHRADADDAMARPDAAGRRHPQRRRASTPGMVPGARHIPLAELAARAGELDADQPVRGLLRRWLAQQRRGEPAAPAGLADVSDILGGYGAWAATRPVG